jgi:opacity protein-like surface antigen
MRILLFALFAAWTPRAFAQMKPNDLPVFESGMKSAGLQLGLNRPMATRDFDQDVGPGAALNLTGSYYLWDWISVGAELGYVTFGARTHAATDAKGVTADIERVAAGFYADITGRFNLIRERTWTPYFLGGVGRHAVVVIVTPKTPGGSLCSESGACTSSAIGLIGSGMTWTAGGGIEFFVIRGMTLSLEARYRQFSLSGGWLVPDSIESLSYLLGMTFHFGYS